MNYNRKIYRPSFSQLNPFQYAMSEYTYIVGNPDLKPVYSTNVSLSSYISNKYMISINYSKGKGSITQVVTQSPDDERVLFYKHMNLDDKQTLMFVASIPIDISKNWWRMTLNMNTGYSDNVFNGKKRDSFQFVGQMINIFTLPKQWSFELNGTYLSPFIEGVMELKQMYKIDMAVRKSFAKNKFTASISANDVLNTWKMNATINEDGFKKHVLGVNSGNNRSFSLSLRYNFNAGKSVKVKKVEAGNSDDKSRF